MFYQLHFSQTLNCSIDDAWSFITTPSNLKKVTPKAMSFRILSDNDQTKVYPGMIIIHEVVPLLGIKMKWMTEITQCMEKKRFVDEQRVGPYKMWHHQHIIEDHESHVIMKDIITYIPPFGIIGRIANKVFIKKKINSIFQYRREILDKLFN